MSNVIKNSSKIYAELLDAYETENKIERFEKCYGIVDAAEYKDIHYVITMLKESERSGDPSNIPFDSIETVVKALISLFAGKDLGKKAFFLDILEEARERKRCD